MHSHASTILVHPIDRNWKYPTSFQATYLKVDMMLALLASHVQSSAICIPRLLHTVFMYATRVLPTHPDPRCSSGAHTYTVQCWVFFLVLFVIVTLKYMDSN